MTMRKYAKKTWKTLTSPKTKATYKSAGKTFSKAAKFTARYFDNMNKNLDNVVGTRDPYPRGRLTGVKIKKRRKR